MAKVAVPGTLKSNALPYERAASKVQPGTTRKRPTPAELRLEQMHKRNCAAVVDELPASLLSSEKKTGEIASRHKKPETKNPRYIDTRVDDVYPARKSSNRLTLPFLKEKLKDKVAIDQCSSLKKSSLNCELDGSSKPQLACPESSRFVGASAEDNMVETCSMTDKSSQNTFRTVGEISSGNGKSSSVAFDVAALKTLGARESSAISHLPNEHVERSAFPFVYKGNFSSEFHITGHKVPLDLTLKTTMRLVSSSSVNWCHRLTSSSNYISQLTSQFGSCQNQNSSSTCGISSAPSALFSKSLHSWVHPQSSLPPSVISVLNLSAGQGELHFLAKRQQVWEDSFRSIYYMLRKNICNIFYVSTSQFVVMFTSGDRLGKTNQTCNAYISQSTRGLRSLLREHEIIFSMPLCHSEAEHATAEDLVELSEIGKHNLGQIRRVGSTSDVDNCPESLLAFSGNESVHGLYDFLLNYRSFLNTLVGGDVPVLYAPVPFHNASLSVPEVKCKEMKRANSVSSLVGGSSKGGEFDQDSSTGVCYSIEIKDTVIPPWTICGICSAMCSDGRSFDASFISDPVSIGLNVAFDTVCEKLGTDKASNKSLQWDNATFGISEAVVAPDLRSASLRGLKYSSDTYTACICPV